MLLHVKCLPFKIWKLLQFTHTSYLCVLYYSYKAVDTAWSVHEGRKGDQRLVGAKSFVPVRTESRDQPPMQWVPSLFPGGKAAGAWV